MYVTREKNCYCHTCAKYFHYLGITNHRRGHRDRMEDCKITFTYGDTYFYRYSRIHETKLKKSKPISLLTHNKGL